MYSEVSISFPVDEWVYRRQAERRGVETRSVEPITR